jgi:hypothetical protein
MLFRPHKLEAGDLDEDLDARSAVLARPGVTSEFKTRSEIYI